MEKLVLEPSTNTHCIEASRIVKKDMGNSVLKLDVDGFGIVTHGEHGTIRTESRTVIKYVQQEVNPVTKKLQNAYD